MKNGDILDEKVIGKHGAVERVRRWWRGVRPEKGTIIFGLTGLETVEEFDRIRALHTVRIPDAAVRRAA